MKLQKIIITLFFLFLFSEFAWSSETQIAGRDVMMDAPRKNKKKSSNKAKDDSKQLSAYDKLFTGKKVKSAKGLMTLHKVDGKVYIEIPFSLLNNSFLLSSGVERVSNMLHGYIGQMPSRPIQVVFSKVDSLVTMSIVEQQAMVDENDPQIRSAVEKSGIRPIIQSFPVLARNEEQNTVVFDATPFFLSNSRYLGTFSYSTFGGFVANLATFNKGNSSLLDVTAYDDNVVITNNMTYSVKTYFMGMETNIEDFMTVEVSYVLSLLPTEKMSIRYADPRIGTAISSAIKYSSKEQGAKEVYYTNRWRIEPKDEKAYRAGELVEPKSPIVFYIDTLFYPSWRQAIKEGIEKWNKAFEKIGLKQVILAMDYPNKATDSLFNPSNAKYNCVKFSQMASRGIGRRIAVDPTTGEILSASLFVGRDFPITLQRERIYKTAALEPRVRAAQLPDELLGEALSSALMQEVGFCLGLSANLAGTSWIPVDSLRSPSFTQREGITSSVMDVVRYNYVAQPGDIEKGVTLMVNDLGVYDYYAIRWLYQPIYEAKNVQDEKIVLSRWIEEKKDDPRYYYGKEQNWRSCYDPRALAKDLGNDQVKATLYGIENLKYVARHAAPWIDKNDTDESYKELFGDFILLQLYDYMQSLAVNVGGMKINEKFVGDTHPTYEPLPKEVQRKTYKAMIEIASDLTWMDNKDLLYTSGLNATFSESTETNLINFLFTCMNNVLFTQDKFSNTYTIDEMLGDITDFSLKNVKKGVQPKHGEKIMLQTLVKVLIQTCDFPKVRNSSGGFASNFITNNFMGMKDMAETILRVRPDDAFANEVIAVTSGKLRVEEISGFMPLQVKYMTPSQVANVFYKHLLKVQKELKNAIPMHKDPHFKSFLEYLDVSISKVVQ